MAQRKRNLLCKTATLALLVTAVLCCNLLLSEKDVYTAQAEVDENGFDIQDGVLVEYTGYGWNTIVIPKGVTKIGDYAFDGYYFVDSIIIPNSVTTIGRSAFSSCSRLTSITIPEGVTTIEDSAFSSCREATRITIPESVTSIGKRAFGYSSSTNATFYVVKGSVAEEYVISEGFNYEYIGESTKEGLEIQDGVLVKYTGDATEVVVPGGVTEIGDMAFYYCENLTKITLPDSITKIGDKAFYCCENLTEIKIPDYVTWIGDYAFGYCSNLTEVTFSCNRSIQINEGAFSSCDSLVTITLPHLIFGIDDRVFSYCEKLEEVKFPSGLGCTSVGEYAFYCCYNLTTISLEYTSTIEKYAFSQCKSLTEITIPKSLTSISAYAFAGTGLTSITLHDSFTFLSNGVFSGCTDLKDVSLQDSKLFWIPGECFQYCVSLTSISLPETISSIDQSAFEYCESLTGIYIPNCVTDIGQRAFAYCTNLKTVIIPSSVTNFYQSFLGVYDATFYVVKGSYGEEYVIENDYNFEYYEEHAPLAEGVTISSGWNKSICSFTENVTFNISIVLPKDKIPFTIELYDDDGAVFDTILFDTENLDSGLGFEIIDDNCHAYITKNYSFTTAGKQQYIIKYIDSDGAVRLKGTPSLIVQRPDVASQAQLEKLKSFAGEDMSEFLSKNMAVEELYSGLIVPDKDNINQKYTEYSYRTNDGETYTFFVKTSDKTLVTDYTVLQKLWYVKDCREFLMDSAVKIREIEDEIVATERALKEFNNGEAIAGVVGIAGNLYLSKGKSFSAVLGKAVIDQVKPNKLMEAVVASKYTDYHNFISSLSNDISNEAAGASTRLSNYNEITAYIHEFNNVLLNYYETRELLINLSGVSLEGSGIIDTLRNATSHIKTTMDYLTSGLSNKLFTGIGTLVGGYSPQTLNEAISCVGDIMAIMYPGEVTVESTDDIAGAIVKGGSLLKGGDILRENLIDVADMSSSEWYTTTINSISFLQWCLKVNDIETEYVDYHQTTEDALIVTNEVYSVVKEAAKHYIPMSVTCLNELPEMLEVNKEYVLDFEVTAGTFDYVNTALPHMKVSTKSVEQVNGKTIVHVSVTVTGTGFRTIEIYFYSAEGSCSFDFGSVMVCEKIEYPENSMVLEIAKITSGNTKANKIKPLFLKDTSYGYEIIEGKGGDDALYPSYKNGNTCYLYRLGDGCDSIYDYEGKDMFCIIGENADITKVGVTYDNACLVITYDGKGIARFDKKLGHEKYKDNIQTSDRDDNVGITICVAKSVSYGGTINGKETQCTLGGLEKLVLKLPRVLYNVGCPVDVYVYDPDGNVVQALYDGQESSVSNDYGVFIVEYDTERDEYIKQVYLYDETYTVKIIGNDEGTMEYTVVKVNEDGSADIYEQKEIPVSKYVTLSVDAENHLGLTDDFGNVTTIEKVEAPEKLEITSDIFLDAVFKEFILTNLDTDGDSSLSFEEADAVTSLDVSGLAISSLKGIECFTELESLNLSGCMVTSLDLSQNTKLVTLDVSGSGVTIVIGGDIVALSGLPGLDASNVIAWTGATYDAATDSLTEITGDVVTYTYDCGNGLTAEFTLVVQRDPIEAFVTRMYRIILEREPDAGSSTWINGLKDGSMTGVRVADGFVLSEEMLNKDISNEEFVKVLYRAFFGREADADGLATWKGLLDAGCKKTYVFAGFANSTEFGNLCAEAGIVQGRAAEYLADRQTGLSEADYKVWCFVERMYMEVLNRTADEPGVRSWVAVLLDGSFTGTQVAEGFIMSEEFLAKNMTNEEYVRIMYRAFFGRDADSEGLTTWTNALATGWTKKDVFAGFANSNEFGVLCEQAGIVKGTAEGK